MLSNWEEAKKRSNYHFDAQKIDSRSDVITRLGSIENTWQNDLRDLIEKAKPATWATRGYKGEMVLPPREDLTAEEYDLTSHGMKSDMQITHINWKLPASLKAISDALGLADCMDRIHVQMPGEVWNLHIDKLNKWAPENPDSVLRIFIQLTDWQPGQFWEYGNYHWHQWRAGDVSTFDWKNIPHCTANAGYHPRVTYQLTGVITDKTKNFLSSLQNSNMLIA